MKVKQGFVLRQIARNWIVLPLEDQVVDFSGILTLNDSGAKLWKCLEQNCDRDMLVALLTSEYVVSETAAGADVDRFLDKLRQAGCLEE